MTAITLHRIVISQEKLARVPESERSFLVYASHISNELNWFGKMLLTLHDTLNENKKSPNTEREADTQALIAGTSAQALMLTRLHAGKICEALNFIRDFCFGRSWFEELCPSLPAEAQHARRKLHEYLCPIGPSKKDSKHKLLKTIRDKYGFHYDKKQIRKSGRVSELDLEFDMYLAEDVGNTLYFGSERVIYATLGEAAGYTDLNTLIDDSVEECIKVGRWIKDLLGHSLAELCGKYFGSCLDDPGQRDTFEVEAPPLRANRLPYFCSNP